MGADMGPDKVRTAPDPERDEREAERAIVARTTERLTAAHDATLDVLASLVRVLDDTPEDLTMAQRVALVSAIEHLRAERPEGEW